MQEKILVTGGAGFIGTHTVIELIQAGHQVVVVDNLVNSNRKSLEVVERITGVEVPFYEADIRDTDKPSEIFSSKKNQQGHSLCWLEGCWRINTYPSCLL